MSTDNVLYQYDPQWRGRGFVGAPGHRGLDIGMDTHEPCYALEAGTVVAVVSDDELGGYVVVQTGGTFHGYCHMIPQVSVGDWVAQGQMIALTAGWDDDHGSAWDGPHLHKTEGTDPRPWIGVRDPVPTIDRVLDAIRNPRVREGSLLSMAQAHQLAAWLDRTYDTQQYWNDVQVRGRWGGWYPDDYRIDGEPGAQTFYAEQQLWIATFATPAPQPAPVEPEVPAEPTPEPVEPEPVPEPTPDPVTPAPDVPEEEPMPDVSPDKSVLDPVHSKSAMEALRNMLSPTVRVYIYVIFGVIGVALGTWQTWLVSTDQLAPWFFAGIVAVYAYLGTFIAILAAPNTKG